jgi:hypothetical protein
MRDMQVYENKPFNLAPKSFEELERLGSMVANSSICPDSLRGRAGDVVIIIQTGYEVGLQPMQALRTIGCINGKPIIYGDGLLALVKKHKDFQDMKEWIETGEKGFSTAYCTMWRKGQTEQTRSFSYHDAVRAGLSTKPGPWMEYPLRMLQHRARTFCARDLFPDALFGLLAEDEARDITPIKKMHVTKTKGIQGLKESLGLAEEAIFTTEENQNGFQANV